MKKEQYRVTVNSTETNLTEESLADENLISLPDNGISLIVKNRSFRSSIVNIDQNKKTVTLLVDGILYNARVETGLDIQLKTMGFGNASTKTLKEIKAPMPGMVLEVNTAEGENVEAGTKLLVLEAMKMENVIAIPAPGKIKKILVKKGEAVQKNQVLIELDNG